MVYSMQDIKKRKAKQGGFTLVELMVVVAVIGILAAIAVPQFTSAADKARIAREKANIQVISQAAQLYCVDDPSRAKEEITIQKLKDSGYLSKSVTFEEGIDYKITATPNHSGAPGAVDISVVGSGEKNKTS